MARRSVAVAERTGIGFEFGAGDCAEPRRRGEREERAGAGVDLYG